MFHFWAKLPDDRHEGKENREMKKTLVCCAAACLLFAQNAQADETISVTVQAYDYTAAGTEGASESGVIMDYTFEVPAGTKDEEAIAKAFTDKSIDIVGLADHYVSAINGLSGAYPAGWCVAYNNDSYNGWGIGYMGPAGDGVLSDGDVIRFDFTSDGGIDIGNAYYGLPTLTELTAGDETIKFSKETVYDSETYAGITTYYIGEGDAKQVITGTGTQDDPFVITIAPTDPTAVNASAKICMNANYASVKGLDGTLNVKDGATFSVESNMGVKAYYVLKADTATDTADAYPAALIMIAACGLMVLCSRKRSAV